MSTLAQDTNYDFKLTATNNGKVGLSLVTDVNVACAQKLANRFQFFLGEWFLDTTQGVPYFQFVLGVKQPDLGAIEQLFRSIILSTPPITAVSSFTINFDNAKRELDWSFAALTSENATVSGGSGLPFIVTPNTQ